MNVLKLDYPHHFIFICLEMSSLITCSSMYPLIIVDN